MIISPISFLIRLIGGVGYGGEVFFWIRCQNQDFQDYRIRKIIAPVLGINKLKDKETRTHSTPLECRSLRHAFL